LVLSEFTGAADALAGALMVNPHDIDGMKDVFERAVQMEPAEQRRRMRKLRRRVLHDDVARWSQRFLSYLMDDPPKALVGSGEVEPASPSTGRAL
ncbi:MAG: trehalose-6-phosphate synthase, partial [Actinotalea sp.]|nr:trehalose-6-phosphate synthase [Actinotalea sp.]